MHIIEKDALFAPGTPMISHRILFMAQHHSLSVSLYDNRMVSVPDRYRIVVVVETYQRQRTCCGRLLQACIEGRCGEGRKSSLIFNQELRFGSTLAAKTPVEIFSAQLR